MEDTPCLLKHVVIVAYETMYQKNPDAAKRIHQEVSNFLLDTWPVCFSDV